MLVLLPVGLSRKYFAQVSIDCFLYMLFAFFTNVVLFLGKRIMRRQINLYLLSNISLVNVG